MTVVEIMNTADTQSSATHPDGTGAFSPPPAPPPPVASDTHAKTAMLSGAGGGAVTSSDPIEVGIPVNNDPYDPINIEVMVADLAPSSIKWIQSRTVTEMSTLVMIAEVCDYPAATTTAVSTCQEMGSPFTCFSHSMNIAHLPSDLAPQNMEKIMFDGPGSAAVTLQVRAA